MIIRKNVKQLLWWLPAALTMIIIFWFSSKNATESDATSNPIATEILTIIERIIGRFDGKEHVSWLELLNFVVRKAAHVTEYVILGITINIGFYHSHLRNRKLFLFSLLMATAYAATDEFHQLFVEGRSGQITDVCIDTVGCLIGCLLTALFIQIRNKKKNAITYTN